MLNNIKDRFVTMYQYLMISVYQALGLLLAYLTPKHWTRGYCRGKSDYEISGESEYECSTFVTIIEKPSMNKCLLVGYISGYVSAFHETNKWRVKKVLINKHNAYIGIEAAPIRGF